MVFFFVFLTIVEHHEGSSLLDYFWIHVSVVVAEDLIHVCPVHGGM